MGSEIEGMEAPSEVQRSEGDSMLSIERMEMRERALGGAKCNGAETSARDRTLPLYSTFVRLGLAG